MNSRIYRLALVLVLVVSGLIGCAPRTQSPAPQAPAASPTVALKLGADVNVDQVHALYQQGAVVIVDVREVDEYEAGHIPGALLIPLSELEKRVKDVPRDAEVILVCRSGNRSQQAYTFLRQQGLTNVHNMPGGMKAWVAAGYAIEP